MRSMIDDQFELIPHVDATPEQKRAWEKTMRLGNRVLKQHYERVAAKCGGMRKYSKNQFRIDLFAAVKTATGCVRIHDVPMSKNDLNLILAVRAIEWDVLCSLSKMIHKAAAKWYRRANGSNLEFADFYNEATMAVSDALYGFDRDNITFITYAHVVVHHRLINRINENKPLCPWTLENKSLYKKFTTTAYEMSLDLGREATFEEVSIKLKLTDDQISDMRDMSVMVVNHTDLIPNDAEDDDYLADVGVYGVVAPEQDKGIDLSILADVNMNSWEKAVLEAYLAAPSGSRGWQTEVAAQHINPDTGTPYSRRAPRIALRRIIDKIQKVHAKAVADAAAA